MILEEFTPGDSKIKAASFGAFSASGEPGLQSPPAQTKRKKGEVKHRNARNSYVVKGVVNAATFAEIESMKGIGEDALSRQAVVTDLIDTGLAVKIGKREADMLIPRVEQKIDKKMSEHTNRITYLESENLKVHKEELENIQELLRIFYEVLHSPKEFHEFVQQARNKARGSL